MAIRSQVIIGLVFLAIPGFAQIPPTPAPSAAAGEQRITTAPDAHPVLTLEQMPSGPTIVTYDQGKLTIEAQNARLGDVLHALSSRLGILLELPSGADERVVALTGPGPVREVIASLLNGTKFNYVFLGSTSDPKLLSRIILSPKPASKTASDVGLQMVADGQTQSSGGYGSAQATAQPVASSEPVSAQQPAPVASSPMASSSVAPSVASSVEELRPLASVLAELAKSTGSTPLGDSAVPKSSTTGDSGSFLHRLRRQRQQRQMRPSPTQ